jgi:tetratricopeptide (TPR) repeat protein
MRSDAIGPYQILEKLGAGGMGEVYLAHDPRLGRRVALKTVSSSTIGTTDARASLLREASAAAKLNHPNIAAVYDVLDDAEGLHIVMEYVEGESAASLVRRGRLPVDKVVDIGIQLMDALEDAHAHGVLHRDIKPGNMMITPQGRVKVLDFGLAKISNPLAPVRHGAESGDSHVIVGTLGYMAPERLLHRDADQRADLYAAGALLFEMLTGRLPYEEPNYPALAVIAMTEAPPPPNALNPQVPEPLSNIVLRALAREPAERYGSAAEFRRDLVHVADGLRDAVTGPVEWEASPSGRPPARPARRWRGITSVIAAVIVAIVAWILWTLASRQTPAQAFGERDWVLIADFDNNTAEPLFEHTLRATLETALQQSRYVNVFPRAQVFDALRRMRVSDTSRLDEARAVELGKRENIKVVLAGSALASGNTFQISMRAVETASGNLLFAEARRFTRKEQLFDQVDSLALAVREKLGEAVSRTGKETHRLAQVTTSSLEALELYSRATDELARGGIEKSRDLLEAALARDPDFAMAHVRLGDAYTALGQFEKTRQHYQRAYQLRDRVTDRESYSIQSRYFEINDQYDKARDSWRVLTQLYPDDATARIQLGLDLQETGDFEAAVPELRYALKLNPFHGSAHATLVLLLARLGRPDEAIDAYEQAVARGIDTPYVLWGSGLARTARGENDMARDTFTRLAASGGAYRSLGELYLAQLDSYEGKLSAARDRFNAGLALDVKLANLANELHRHFLLGRVFLLQGDRASAAQQARAILAAGQESLIPQNLYQAGTLLVRAGNVGPARDVLRRLEGVQGEKPSPFHRTILEVLKGEIALAGGQLKDAEAAFRVAADGYPGSEAHEGLARVLTRRKEWSPALEEWNRVLALRGDILQVGFAADWPLAHLGLARACRDAGDRGCATRHYEEFINLWQRGDSSIRRDAEEELRQLAR